MLATRIKRIVFLFISCLILCHISQAQFQFQNSDEWERVKTDTAYVLLNNVASSKNDPVKELFNTYWKISPVRYLEASDFENHLSPDALYFSLVYRTETSFSASPQEGYYNSSGWHTVGPLSTGGSSSLTINLNWQLWTCKEDYFKKKKRWKTKYINSIAVMGMQLIISEMAMNNAELSGDRILGQPMNKAFEEKLKEEKGVMIGASADQGYDEDLFWGLGIMKNYVQILNRIVTSHTKKGGPVPNTEALKNLKTDTLFVPDYIRQPEKFRAKMIGGYKQIKTKELFEYYKFSHSAITMRSLNDKITAATKDFYYLLYVGNHICVIDGLTGDVVYAMQISELNSDVMDDLYNAILKG